MKQERQSYQATLLRLWERYKFFVVAILLGAVLTSASGIRITEAGNGEARRGI